MKVKAIFQKSIFFLLLYFSITSARAQYVAIPDTIFGNWLYDNYINCVTGSNTTGWQLDTTCSYILSVTSLNCLSSGIHNLSGIQYFKNLTYLNCGQNPLTNIPALPASLTWLDCTFDSLTSLPTLPSGLITLYCDENQLASLPALPSGIITVYCHSNRLTSLPALPSSMDTLGFEYNELTTLPALPSSLQILECSNNHLTSLPALPSGLVTLYCTTNSLSSLPTLPSSLTSLRCDYNQLSSIPALPSGLSDFECSANQLTILPSLSPVLNNLNCNYNQLTSLPSLPSTLTALICGDNLLTSIPLLPDTLNALECGHNLLTTLPNLSSQLQLLFCDSNQLTGLPVLPYTMTYIDCRDNPALSCLPRIPGPNMYYFYIYGTAISCMPNRFTMVNNDYDINPATLPLCDPISGCSFYYNIAGNVHLDTAGSCLNDSLSPGVSLANVKVELIQNNTVIQQFYTDNSGDYSFDADSLSAYSLAIDTANIPFSVSCPLSVSNAVVLSSADSLAPNENFGVLCSYDYAVEFIYGRFRPGILSLVDIYSGNLSFLRYFTTCRGGESGKVMTILSGPVQYFGPAPGSLSPSVVSGDTLIYDISSLDSLSGYNYYLNILVTTDSTAIIGSQVCVTGIISPSTPDAYPGDDTLTNCFTVRNSFDPNYKSVYPTTLSPDGSWLTYTIEFQNTGTDTAYEVVVRDTLSPYLDASSFQYIASDHKAVIQLKGNSVAFAFPQINLPDSSTNPSGSQAWIQYRVKTKPNLPQTAEVQNTAYVYFDLNSPVLTNTVNTAYPSGINTISNNSNTIHLYPNPNGGSFTLETIYTSDARYSIYDMLGDLVSQHSINSAHVQIDLPKLAAGVYTLIVRSGPSSQALKFVVAR